MSSPPVPSSPFRSHSNQVGSSSPLFFPSSSPAPFQEPSSEAPTPRGRNYDDVSSPLRYSSSPGRGLSSGAHPLTIGDQASTPKRNRRGDVFSSDLTPSRRYINSDPVSDAGSFSQREHTSDANPHEPVRVIWGTNVSIQDSMTSFRGFLEGFKAKYRDEEPAELQQFEDAPAPEALVYMKTLENMRILGLTNLNLDVSDLKFFPPTRKLYYQLINYPQEIIPIMDQTIKDVMVSTVSPTSPELDEIETKVYKVRPFGLESQHGMRELNPRDIDKLVSIKGLVIRATPVIPDMKEAFFKCSVCNHTVVVEIDRGTIAEPTKCPRQVCGQAGSMQIVHNRSTFADKQVVRLQETPDIVPDGQTPHSVSLCVYDELVDVCKAGDKVNITGIFRSVPVRMNSTQRTLKSLFKTYVDVVHIQKSDKKRMGIDVTTHVEPESSNLEAQFAQAEVEETRRISDAEILKIHQVAERSDVYELLAHSLAPSIYEQDDVKKGILLQLFGGTNKTFSKGGSPRYRGDINILLCGDPSTSKSQLLQYVHKIAPRGVYTSGKGSSAVGLTAYVTRDPETRQLVLESGALVLSDGGVCCIDEFDKMSDSTRSVLHEVMEQQTISVAKAGIITTLNARTSILASANPVGSKYDPTMSVTRNIDLPPPLLSRFDLVYLMLDKVDDSTDRMLAKHLTAMYLEDAPENGSAKEILPVEFLTLYISYAKQNIHPVITEAAREELIKAYVEMRKLGEDARSADKRITATTRQLESMIRLSEAHAKMRLSEEITAADVLEAVRLIRSAIKEYATDPISGQIDMDLIQTGTSAAERRLRSDLRADLLKIVDTNLSNGSAMRYTEVVALLTNIFGDSISNFEIGETIRSLEQEGFIVIQGEGQRRSIRRA